MTRRTTGRTDREPPTSAEPRSPLRLRGGATPSGLSHHQYVPRTAGDVEEDYVAARDAWKAAMRAANSGLSADLAALAIAQEAYEMAAAERERWQSGAKVPIPIEPEGPHQDLGAVVGQELAWRQVRKVEEPPSGLFGRLRRHFRGDRGD